MLNTSENSSHYEYQVSGSLKPNADSYVVRKADTEFYQLLHKGELCYVFNARQMGKSSLRVRAMKQLQSEGFVCAYIDLTGMGKVDMTIEKWYAGLIQSLVSSCQLGAKIQWRKWWKENKEVSSPSQLFTEFIENILLVEIQQPIIIFIDEIDRVLSQSFSLDEFFGLIRYFYNQRVDRDNYRRLNFALLGVATPTVLIQDKTQNPFNIGKAIILEGFKFHEVDSLIKGLRGKVSHPKEVMKEILFWTGGQPFLTQKLCQLVIDAVENNSFGGIEGLVQTKILENWESQDDPQHLRTIRDRLLHNEERSGRLLGLYQEILQHPDNIISDESLDQWELRLSGLVVAEQGKLKVYNPIYAKVFNQYWLTQELDKLRPYSQAFNAWIDSQKEDKSRLLRGTALQEAVKWSSGKGLSELDYQFLSASKENNIEEINQEKLRHRLQQLQLISILATSVALIALGLGWKSQEQQQRAEIAEVKSLNLLTQALLSNETSKENLETLMSSIRTAQQFLQLKQPRNSAPMRELYAEIEENLKHTVYDTLEQTRLSHNNTVAAITFSPDGQWMASASADGTAKIWQMNGQLYKDLLHPSDVYDVVFSPNSQWVVTTCKDKILRIWNLQGEVIQTFRNEKDTLKKIAFSPDGKFLAVTTLAENEPPMVKIWSLKENKIVQTLEETMPINNRALVEFRDIAFSPDGQLIAVASTDKTLKLWKVNTGELFKVLEGHQDWVYSISFSPDGQLLASSGGGSDRSLKLWRLSDGQLLKTIEKAHQDSFYVEFSPNGQLLATSGSDQTLKIWDTQNILALKEESLHPFENPSILLKEVKGHQSETGGLSFSPSGQMIALAGFDQKVTLWRFDPVLIRTIKASEFGILKVIFSPDGQMIASAGSDNILRLWNQQGKLLQAFPGHQDWIFGISFSPDGQMIASASEDGTVKIWDIKKRKQSRQFRHEGKVYDVAFSPDGQYIASVGDDGLQLRQRNNLRLLRQLEVENNIFWAWSLQFSPDSQQIAATAREGVKIWHIKDEKSLKILQENNPQKDTYLKLTFSPDGKRIAVGSIDNTVKLWDIETEKIITSLKGHQKWVNDVSFSADNQMIATASTDKTLKLWTIQGQLLRTLEGHEGTVKTLRFSPDQTLLISADTNGLIKFWNVDLIEKSPLDLMQLIDRGCQLLANYLQYSSQPRLEEQQLCVHSKSI